MMAAFNGLIVGVYIINRIKLMAGIKLLKMTVGWFLANGNEQREYFNVLLC
jgi:hypothetical protein